MLGHFPSRNLNGVFKISGSATAGCTLDCGEDRRFGVGADFRGRLGEN